LLAFSRQQVMLPRRMNINDVVRGVDRMLRRLIGEDIEVLTSLAPELGVVKADPGQMDQILMNLIINARDAMPNGGKLTIQTQNMELNDAYFEKHGYVSNPHQVMLSISDNGMGMDADTQARLFEPFFTTKEPGKGTGLGLSMVYGIVKQSGGSIEVYSELGHGTTFKVYLPRVDAPADEVAASSPVHSRTRGTERVLLVEDDVQLRQLVTSILTQRGYGVYAMQGLEDLDQLLKREPEFQLLLTDVVMPRMSGPQVARRVLEHSPAVKVLYMSGYTTNAIVHHGVLDEGLFFLQKPFTPSDLAAKVREVLDSPAPPR
jgi:CheY-like chemotaxis protein